MNERQAEAIADALGGEAWQSGGGIWVVSFHRGDGKIVLISDELVCVYADDDALDRAEALQTIELQAGDDAGLMWVVQDADGNVYFRNAEMGVGWRWREEAEQEARGIQSRTGVHCFAREQSEIESRRN